MLIIHLRDIDINALLDFYNKIEDNIVWSASGHKGKQAGLQ